MLTGTKPKGYAESWLVQLYDWVRVNKYDLYSHLKNVDAEGQGELSKGVLVNVSE